jgi:PAS domain S-box-containing protein
MFQHVTRPHSELDSDDAAQLRLAAIVASADDAIIAKDLNGTITSWNQAAERIFGYTEAEAIGQSIRLIIPPDRQNEEDEVLRQISAGQIVDHFETVRVRKDGRLINVSLTISPLKTASGRIIGASKIARDITQHKRLDRDARWLAALVESSDDAIISKGLDGVVTSWNRGAERIFGYTPDEMIGRSIRVLVPEDLHSEEDEVIARLRRGESVEHYETVRRRKDGTLFPISLTVSPIRGEDGSVIGASNISRDISDRKAAEIERQRLLRVAQEASQLKDEFLATLSHELRTPLNAILGYTRMMRSGLLSAEKHEKALETVARNATSLTQIVEDVLDVSRIISGKIRLNIEAVELPAVVREALDTVRPAAEAKRLQIDMVVEADASTVSGDAERLQQIMWNLLSNAVKFTPPDGRIDVRLARVASHVEVTVRDTGIGIPPEFLPYVFERFRQADSSVSREYGGLGLGLAISRHLIELQGGRISVSSEGQGKGSTFRVELPVRAVAGVRADRLQPGPAVAAHITVPDLRGVRILAVDDDPDALSLIREILEATNADVQCAASGQEALGYIEQAPPHVLVADIGMPRMSGFDLIGHIRQSSRPEVRAVRAAALTAYARSEERAKAIAAGFNLHLTKPIDPAELMTAMASLAAGARISS